MDEIGIFGLGLIGRALAARLIGAGHAATGYDPSEEAQDAFADLGGRIAEPGDVWACGTVLSAVFDTGQLEQLIEEAPAGARTLISTSTCDPERMPDLEARAAAKSITLIEAPLSGTSRDLAEGRALFLLGGDAGACRDLGPLLDLLGRAHRHMGAVGSGNRAKLAINLVLGLNRAALAEGLVFAEAGGIDPDGFLDLLKESAAASKVMDSKGPLMTSRDFRPLGRIAQSAKDFRLIREMGGGRLPFAETYGRMIEDGVEAGEGNLDNSAILLAIERAVRGG